ncbi:uncharacterized protein LOC121735685 [Aricia agestis]|uniref:uncharacterized protein LOC121735685 n=1 Tax=Aricia agestis TaxID=91739 RepID=UPI001C20C345|nr:uncharacterized protein LOC121735685 [Aricia agestis]
MSKVDLYYFPLKALGEPARLLLAYNDVQFNDHRLTKDEWAKFKPSTPFGQLPMLVIDGKKYTQSMAISRYLGHKYGLAGDSLEDSFQIDQNVDFFYDIRLKAYTTHHEKDEAAKAAKHEALVKDYYPTALAKLDELIKKNNGHLALGKLTWADFLFAGVYDHFKVILQMPDLDTRYPSFRQVYDTVYSLPKVKAFSEKAPKSVSGSMGTVLHYFDVKGLGEALRLLLAYGREPFTDHRVTFAEWPTFKTSTPLQQMPVLEMNGRVYTQSSAIAKYLGRKYGLVGQDLEEDFKIDESLEFLGDIRYRASMVHYEPDAAVKARKHDTFSKDFYPRALKELDRIIRENDGHLALGRLTWVDFVFAGMFDYLKVMLQMPDLDVQYPSFRQVVDNVYSIPHVKTWCDTAQKSELNF